MAASTAPRARKSASTATAQPTPARTDLASLAGGVKQVAALPKVSRAGGGSRNPFIALVEKSRTEGVVLATGLLPDEAVTKTVVTAIRRAASNLGLGVSVRTEASGTGFVVSFEARTRKSAA